MCGIVGFFDATLKSNETILFDLSNLIRHRGPDDQGTYFTATNTGNVGLGHRRLSIIDLSPLGHQPMHFENLTIVFNGEIYNFHQIRTRLESVGYSFQSTSDTEVVLKAFHCWGLKSVEQLNGMFAIALYDKLSNELYLIRDRMGVKPLFYFYDGKSIFFSSELKPIMAAPFLDKLEINKRALNSYLFHGYINAPNTIFENVFKLEAGHYLKFQNGKVDISDYWSVKKVFQNAEVNYSLTEDKVLDDLDELINTSVKHRMISDVPIGAFLSGGIDSSLVSAVMQRNSSSPINTFTIGFNEARFNEAHFARKVAEYLGTNHQERVLPIDEAKELINNIPIYYDEPFADSSQIPTMLVSGLAKENVSVVLSGDGGDEFFCGYSRYDEAYKLARLKRLAALLSPFKSNSILESLLNTINTKLPKVLYLASNKEIINKGYLSSIAFLNGIIKNESYELDRKYFDILDLTKNIQEAYMLQDLTIYLPDDILAKVDRATMSVGLEGREPLLDYRLLEYSFTIPHALKYKNRQSKYLLKKLASRYIPAELIDRPKMGFGVPIYQWLHSDLGFLIDRYFSDEYLQGQNIFDIKRIRTLMSFFMKQPSNDFISLMVWNILVFQLWYDRYRN